MRSMRGKLRSAKPAAQPPQVRKTGGAAASGPQTGGAAASGPQKAAQPPQTSGPQKAAEPPQVRKRRRSRLRSARGAAQPPQARKRSRSVRSANGSLSGSARSTHGGSTHRWCASTSDCQMWTKHSKVGKGTEASVEWISWWFRPNACPCTKAKCRSGRQQSVFI